MLDFELAAFRASGYRRYARALIVYYASRLCQLAPIRPPATADHAPGYFLMTLDAAAGLILFQLMA